VFLQLLLTRKCLLPHLQQLEVQGFVPFLQLQQLRLRLVPHVLQLLVLTSNLHLFLPQLLHFQTGSLVLPFQSFSGSSFVHHLLRGLLGLLVVFAHQLGVLVQLEQHLVGVLL